VAFRPSSAKELASPPWFGVTPRFGPWIAAGAVAKAPPGGYRLLLAPASTLAIAPAIYKKLPYDPVKDCAPVGLVGSAQFAAISSKRGVDNGHCCP